MEPRCAVFCGFANEMFLIGIFNEFLINIAQLISDRYLRNIKQSIPQNFHVLLAARALFLSVGESGVVDFTDRQTHTHTYTGINRIHSLFNFFLFNFTNLKSKHYFCADYKIKYLKSKLMIYFTKMMLKIQEIGFLKHN